jgi:hypothetical protein
MIILKDTTTQKQVYQIAFNIRKDPSVVKQFMDVLQTNMRHYGSEVVTATALKANDIAEEYTRNDHQ